MKPSLFLWIKFTWVDQILTYVELWNSSSSAINAYLLHHFQIEFLNSVIIDLQRKNEELKGKMEKMAAAALNGNNASELDNYDE